MNKTIKLITQIIFYGAIWGIIEATLGHVLHFIPATIAGSIMFPIASVILYKAYKKTDSKMALFYIGIVAATIKSVDLLLPQLSIFKTVNPMVSIVLETLAVVLVVTMLTSKKTSLNLAALPVASVGWRVIFISWMVFQYATTGNLAPYIVSFEAGFSFVIISGLLSGALATGLYYLDKQTHWSFEKIDSIPALASILLIVAFITTYTL